MFCPCNRFCACRRFLYNPERDEYEGVSSRYEQSGRLELQLTYVMERRPRPKGTGESEGEGRQRAPGVPTQAADIQNWGRGTGGEGRAAPC